jgi:hypothetical protein
MSRRSKKIAIIEIDEKKYNARYIGKGQFSRVYQVGNRAIYYTKDDCTKEVLAVYQHDRLPHIPEMIRHDNILDNYGDIKWFVFSSPIYKDVTKRDRSAWELMNKIIKYYYDYTSYLRRNEIYLRGYDKMQGFVDTLEDEKSVPYSVLRSLQSLIDVYSNCGQEIQFDFHRKNFGVNQYGTLIFRDIAYIK